MILVEAHTSLYDLEQDLQALLDTEDMVSDDQRTMFNAELEHAIATTVAKRDRCGEFLKHCEQQAEFAKQESERLRKRADVFANAARRMRGYLRNVIEALGTDPKGKYKRLEGEHFTFSLRKGKESVKIEPEYSVPPRYVTVSLDINAEVLALILHILDEDYMPGTAEHELTNKLHDAVAKGEGHIDKISLKQAMDRGEQFKGVSLERGQNSVVCS